MTESHQQRKHREALTAWQIEYDALNEMRRTARSFEGVASTSPNNPLVLKRGEKCYAEVPNASLVEVQRGAGHYTGGYSGFSFRLSKHVRYNVGGSRGSYVQGDEQLKITDHGMVTVTNKRVVFTGERNTREWTFAKLVSLHNDDTRPITTIGVSNRQKVSGFAYDAAAATDVRFKIALAIAHFQGTEAQLVASLDAEFAEHEKARPVEPAVAPASAPGGLAAALSLIFTGKPTWKPVARAAQALAIAIAAIVVIATASNGGGGSTKHEAIEPPPPASAPVVAVPTPVQTHSAAPTVIATKKPAPKPVVTKAPVVHRHAAPKAVATPTHRATHSSKPASSKPVATHACTTTSSGSCIRGGEFCPDSKDGQYGYDAVGRQYFCSDKHWRVPA
jgi:hypothetical protein